MQNFKIIFTAGIAMFAMFFGSGNLVFPIELGVETGTSYLPATIGFIITGVLVPFIGLYSVMLYDGNRHQYFAPLGERTTFILTIVMLSLMGPFGVMPRCILVAYGAFKALYPSLPVALFSIVFSGIISLVVWRQNQFVPIVGRVLGPIKFIIIILIIIAAIMYAPGQITDIPETQPFYTGVLQGYQTMDLPAAFFFSITIMSYLKNTTAKNQQVLKIGIKSSFIAGSLIAVIYFLFAYLGAHYGSALSDSNPEEYLANITDIALGRNATIIFAIMMFFACLTTAATLCKLFAELLQKDISGSKISWHQSVAITIAISFALSLTGFKAISSFLSVILKNAYPALIAYCLMSIYAKFRPFNHTKNIFWAIFAYEVITNSIL